MSIIKEEESVDVSMDSAQDIKFPIHIGPVFRCNFCQTNFINLDFLGKHHKKCIHQNINSFDKIKFNLKKRKGNVFLEKTLQKKIKQKNKNKEEFNKNSGQMKKKRFFCTYCNKTTSTQSELIIHLRTHTGEKPYECDICKRQFSTNGNLMTHMRTHTGEKPYQCDICRKQFSVNSNLKKHIRTHTQEKPHECEICNKQFSVKASLKIHMRTHTREKTL